MSYQPGRNFLWATAALALTGARSFAAVSPNVIVDQFGYQASAPKIVVFSQPQSGTGSPSSFTPGANFYLVNASGGTTVFTGAVSQWAAGATHTQSGDKAWQGDFSTYTTPGSYYILVPSGQSCTFQINNAVYNGVVTASQRMYLYQRCGDNITSANGGANWNHAACHEGAGQDLAEDLWDNNADQGAGTARDVHGGWHDAGDYGKYITFTEGTMWYLLHSVEWYPAGYTDNTNIPESGNGVPDMLDEVKWELDWMLRMQRSDGALYSMVGNTTTGAVGQGNPANDTSPRFYLNVSTTATATSAMAFALGARIFQKYPYYSSYAVTLQNAAVSAWGYLQANASPVTFNPTGLSSANANMEASWDAQTRAAAAAELFALTGNTTYQTYFDNNYNSSACAVTEQGNFLPTNGAFDPSLAEPLQLGMVSYCLAPGATASVTTAIGNALKSEVEGILNDNLPTNAGGDPYLGYMYDGHYDWGSNQLKASWGNQLLFAAKLGVNPTHTQAYTNQAEEYLHYFHGRNPLNYVYLTNMGSKGSNLGAYNPIMSIFHSWFWQGTTYDGNTGSSAEGPAPGYLSGGPNQFYAPDPSYGGTISPPQNEPPMKSYKDWGATYPQDSWEVTEPDQGYQAKYQFLVSAFAVYTSPTPTPTNTGTPTASPTGTLPTATWTPTVTLTPTRTLSPTPTATLCMVLFNGCETLTDNGTWSGANDSSLSVVTSATAPVSAITQGTHCLQASVTYNPTGGWNDQVFDLSGFTPTNWSNVTQLMLDVNVPAGIIGPGWSQLFLYADSAPTTTEQQLSATTINLVAGENLNVTFNISLTGAFTSSSPITRLYFIYNSNASTGTGTYGSFYVDNLRLVESCASAPTNTATNSPTKTATASMTATPSRTASATASSTSSPSPSSTPTASPTSTPTVSPTVTPSPTNTTTLTPTFSPTPAFTSTFTPTPTVTSTTTNSGTPTASPTGTLPTATNTGTATATFTFSDTPTLTPTASLTATATPSHTTTLTATPTLTSTASLTRTFTPTPVATSTFSQTPTGTPTSSPTPTLSPTPSRTFTLVPTPSSPALFIYPNPADGTQPVVLQIHLASISQVQIRLFTTAFRRVKETLIPHQAPGVPLTLDLKDDAGTPLASGLYYVVIDTNQGRTIGKLLILR